MVLRWIVVGTGLISPSVLGAKGSGARLLPMSGGLIRPVAASDERALPMFWYSLIERRSELFVTQKL